MRQRSTTDNKLGSPTTCAARARRCRLLIKRGVKELPSLRAVKREHKAERSRVGGVGPVDYLPLPLSGANTIEVAILACSAWEEEEVAHQHRRDEEVNDVLL